MWGNKNSRLRCVSEMVRELVRVRGRLGEKRADAIANTAKELGINPRKAKTYFFNDRAVEPPTEADLFRIAGRETTIWFKLAGRFRDWASYCDAQAELCRAREIAHLQGSLPFRGGSGSEPRRLAGRVSGPLIASSMLLSFAIGV